jgi:hypothetical protein
LRDGGHLSGDRDLCDRRARVFAGMKSLDGAFAESGYRSRDAELSAAMLHVCSHPRQRHVVVTVMTFASVSMIRP